MACKNVWINGGWNEKCKSVHNKKLYNLYKAPSIYFYDIHVTELRMGWTDSYDGETRNT